MAESQHLGCKLNDPDSLVASFYQWRTEYEKMVAKTEKLQKEVEFKELQLRMTTANAASLKNDASELSSSVLQLQSAIQNLLHFEVENTALVNKVTQVEEKMRDMQKEYEKTIQSVEAQMMQLRVTHLSEITDLKTQSKLEAQSNREDYKKIIYEKELEILHQSEQMKRLKQQHDEEIMKTKLEYDHKLMKTQEQAKSIKPASKLTISTNASAGIDILRKKMQNMQHLHELETSELKAKLAELQEKLQDCEQLSFSEENQRPTHHSVALKRRKK